MIDSQIGSAKTYCSIIRYHYYYLCRPRSTAPPTLRSLSWWCAYVCVCVCVCGYVGGCTMLAW